MTRPLTTNAPRGLDEAHAALEYVARLSGTETIASIAMEVPLLDAASLVRAFDGELRFLWRDRDGVVHGGYGRAAGVQGSGRFRFEQARDGARDLYRRIAGTKHPLYGGLAFEPGAANSAEWSGFGDARFELPTISYVGSGDSAELCINVCDPLSPSVRRSALSTLEEHARRIRDVAGKAVPTAAVAASTESRDDSGRAHYLALVTRARDLVRSGEFKKLVVARARSIDLEKAPDLAALIGRLDEAYPECTVFSVDGDRGKLVAASPERLATVRGGRVETVALAGTVPLERAADLHSDAKLQLEHRLTVEAIALALDEADGVSEIEVAQTPTLRRLRKLVHLETPITARVDSGVHILDVASALHPTPAVAGIPTAAACGFLDASEGLDRGWYAGLVGWCNEKGEGDLAVALRAGLLEGTTMQLFAGAGIVGDSVPETEWEETALKLSALEAQLGGAVK